MPNTALQSILQPRETVRIQSHGADVEFIPGFLPADHANELFRRLTAESAIDWRQDNVVMFGRTVPQPRLTAWVADSGVSYSYSGLTLHRGDWIPELQALRRKLESALATRFNSVLLNQYRTGNDSMGWHRDNEKSLGDQPVIASVSLGGLRYFDLRHRRYRELGLAPTRFELANGDLLIMRGSTQQYWQHRVPRQATRNAVRINLSFRYTGA